MCATCAELPSMYVHHDHIIIIPDPASEEQQIINRSTNIIMEKDKRAKNYEKKKKDFSNIK